MRLRTPAALLGAALTVALAPAARAQTAIYTFEGIASNTPTPISSTANGLTATFSGPATAVCNITALGFTSLSGQALIQNYCVTGTHTSVDIAFSSALSNARFNFATSVGASTIGVQAFQGATLVGSFTFASVVPANSFFGEGLADVTLARFDRLVLTPVANSALAVDNLAATVAAVPEPATAALVGTGVLVVGAAARRRRGA